MASEKSVGPTDFLFVHSLTLFGWGDGAEEHVHSRRMTQTPARHIPAGQNVMGQQLTWLQARQSLVSIHGYI
eukprot:403106-Amphidinium_carterae.1